jgi:competence protein ComGD
MLLVSLSLNLYPTYIKKMEMKRFVKQFEEDLYYTQVYAISHERPISVYIKDGYYTITSNMDGRILQRVNPNNIRFVNSTLGFKIIFNHVGSPITSGSLYISSEQEKYKVTIYLGKGRIKIEKV